MTLSKDKNNQDNVEIASKKLTWQTPSFEIHELLLKEILTGGDAINENQAASNFLNS